MNLSKVNNEDFIYKNDKLFSIHKAVAQIHENPLRCIKVINNKYKLYSDSSFKGNSRMVQADYYVIDLETNEILKAPADYQASDIIEWLVNGNKKKDIGDFDPFEGI